MDSRITGPLSQQASTGKGIVNPSTSVVGNGGLTDATGPSHGQRSSPEFDTGRRNCNPAQPNRAVQPAPSNGNIGGRQFANAQPATPAVTGWATPSGPGNAGGK